MPPTIGVFDSGFGGLTVLRALLDRVPDARYLFLGDSARLPYGSKSPSTVARFAVSASRFLLDHGADLLVIACNTATALALPEIRAAANPTPVVGVIEPGTTAALALTHTGSQLCSPSQPQKPVISTEAAPQGQRGDETPAFPSSASPEPTVLVLATAATVSSGAYSASLRAAGLTPHEKACPLFVPLVEEGWTDHPVTAEVARIYLAEALTDAPAARTLLLGCTHYPLLAPLLARTAADVLHHPLHLVDSAQATADAVARLLGTRPSTSPEITPPHPGPPANLQVFATDSVDRFQRLGSSFLGRPLPPVHLVDLEP